MQNYEMKEKVQFITHCPECGSKLVRFEGEAGHYCPNQTACPPQIKGRIEHFISRKAMNIDGLGPETVDQLFQQGLIHDVADLYSLKVSDITQLDRMGEKSALHIIESIENSKEVPYQRTLFALGIRFVGETVAKKLAQAFPSIEALENASFQELINVDEIGEKIANSILQFFGDETNKVLVDRLKEIGLQFLKPSDESSSMSDKLEGMSIVISGVFAEHSRDEYKALIEAHGGKNIGSISKKTSFVLAGENMGPAKLKIANKLGVRIVSEKEFIDMIS